MNEQERKFLDWLKTDQPRVGDHEFIKIRESRLEQMTLKEAFLLGVELQRRMTVSAFDLKLRLAALEARQVLAKVER